MYIRQNCFVCALSLDSSRASAKLNFELKDRLGWYCSSRLLIKSLERHVDKEEEEKKITIIGINLLIIGIFSFLQFNSVF